jgi:putative membrane fusion protein
MKNAFKKQGIKIGTLIVLIFLLMYLPSWLYLVHSNRINTDILRMGNIEDVVNVSGVFVRNEEIINAPDSGNCVMDATDGEKVPASFRIATVVKNVPISDYENLKKKELQISKAEISKDEGKNTFSGDIHKLDDEMISQLKVLAKQSDNGSLVNCYSTINNINNVAYRKSDIFGSTSKAEQYINKLKAEKAALESKLNNNVIEIRTKSAGLISFAIDGYESLLTPQYIRNATPSDLEKISVKDTNRDYNIIDAQKGKPIAKLVKDLQNYVLCSVEDKDCKNLLVDDRTTVRINDIGISVKATIVNSSNIIDGKRVVAFSFDNYLNETVGLRKANIDLIKSSYNGLKVPFSSLKNVDTKNKTGK